MADPFKPLLERSFLASEFAAEYEAFKLSDDEAQLFERLQRWNVRTFIGETKIEGAFIGRFFEDTWGYRPDGHGASWTLQQQFAVPGAGASGQSGSAISRSGCSARAGRLWCTPQAPRSDPQS